MVFIYCYTLFKNSINMYKVEKTKTGYKVNVKKDAYNYHFWNEYGHTRMSYNFQKNEVLIPETGQVWDNSKMEWFNLFLGKVAQIEIEREEVCDTHKTIFFNCV